MPIPDDHRQRLEENLSAQERWLTTLRRHIAGLQDEVSAYETMLTLGRDQTLLRVLEELHDRPELFRTARGDPRAFFEQRGVRLPEGAIVTVKGLTENRAPRRYVLEARIDTGTLTFVVGWSPRAGFYAVREFPCGGPESQEVRP